MNLNLLILGGAVALLGIGYAVLYNMLIQIQNKLLIMEGNLYGAIGTKALIDTVIVNKGGKAVETKVNE